MFPFVKGWFSTVAFGTFHVPGRGSGQPNHAPKGRRSDVTPCARLHPTKQALQMLYCAQMGWPGPSTSLPEDFDTWLVVLVVLSS
jgi:hypothetical protein